MKLFWEKWEYRENLKTHFSVYLDSNPFRTIVIKVYKSDKTKKMSSINGTAAKDI